MKNKIEKHTVYGILFAGFILLLIFSERFGSLFESIVNVPMEVVENLMPYYIPIAVIGFPIMFGIYRMVEKENKKLKKKLDRIPPQ